MATIDAEQHVLSPRLGSDKAHSDTTVPDLRHRKDSDVEHVAELGQEHPDPYLLRRGIKTDDELAAIRSLRKSGKKLERFHKRQNDLITSLLKTMEEHTEEARVDEEAARLPVKIAIWASLLANLTLCILQMYGAFSSGSLSLIATAIDSIFDLGSNIMLFWLHRKADQLDVNKWPVGGSRLETIGNVVYGFLMGAANLVIIVESVQTIAGHKPGDKTNTYHIPSLVAVGVALGLKFILFLYCMSYRKASSQVQVLWEDHRNDLFVNGFGLLMSALGSKVIWFLDPMGAVIIAVGVIVAWTHVIYRQFELLAGKSASQDFMKLLVYKAMTFSDEIEKIDTVRAYHSGPEYYVEIDVVMDGSTPLWKAHDISQQLQDKIEVLPHVERAFVHVDHETTHAPVRLCAPYTAVLR
ncbi:CDF manganese transporter [Amylocystis lapponica]|nr:CDF manganese transporter [Amylocystis lapponica]